MHHVLVGTSNMLVALPVAVYATLLTSEATETDRLVKPFRSEHEMDHIVTTIDFDQY